MKAVVIGAGQMGRRHIDVIRAAGLIFAGICDISPQVLATTQEAYQLDESQLFADAQAMLKATQPDVAIVSTTATTHCDYTTMVARAGVKFILCEKPMATSLAECDEMIEACHAHGVTLAINHPMRYMSVYNKTKEIVQSPEFGGLESMTLIAGNMGIAMNATHYFEAFQYLTGEKIVSVSAWFAPENVPNPRGAQYQDKAGSLRLVSETGKRLYIDAYPEQGHGLQVVYAGRYGQLFVDDLAGEMLLSIRRADDRALPTTRYGMPSEKTMISVGTKNLIASSSEMLKALLAGGDYLTGEGGREIMRVLVAAYVSHEHNNHPIDLRQAILPDTQKFPWA